MNSEFTKKYLKYKTKYLELSKYLKKQTGGTISEQMNIYIESVKDKLKDYNIELKNFDDEKKDINIMIISCKKDRQDAKPVLFTMAGYSHNSFRGTADILINSIDELMKKFDKICIAEYDSYKVDQTSACDLRDNKLKKESDNKNIIYAPERKLNDDISIRIDNIIRNKLKLTKVHLLGKCAGAGVLIHTLVKDTTNSIYEALYLAVPGNPFNIIELSEISKEILKKLKFIFSWTKQDIFPFDWGKKSIEEKDVYSQAMEKLEDLKKIRINYTILEQDLKKEDDKKLYHEINQTLIDKILVS